MIRNIFKLVCLLATIIVSSLAAEPSYAGGLFAYTPSDHDRRCLIDLGDAVEVYPVVLQKQLAALPADCHARCPFRNISESFFLRRIKGDALRRHCWMHVTAPRSLSSGDSDSGRKGNVVFIYQNGSGNIIAVLQNGDGNLSYTYQDGSGNVVVVHQNGDGNTAGIAQFGDGNNLNLTQNGDDNHFMGVQTDGDSLALTQSGGQTNTSIQ